MKDERKTPKMIEFASVAEGEPTWVCQECGSVAGFLTVTGREGDCDIECQECGSVDVEEDTSPRRLWVFFVAGGYGWFNRWARDSEAEATRRNKAQWEGAIARKRLATPEEVETGAISECHRHEGFATPHQCGCLRCQERAEKKKNKRRVQK